MKKIGLIFMVIVVFVTGYLVGQTMTSRYFINLNNLINWTDKLSIYVHMRNMSSYIKVGKFKTAKCTADLFATKEYHDLIQCFDKKACSNYQYELARKLAPELFLNEKPFSEVKSCEMVD